jgi:predicted dehydrogenase/nucleoside-diphosphate-sugar epimerase
MYRLRNFTPLLCRSGLNKAKSITAAPSPQANAIEPRLLRIGVVGCGRVAQYHLQFINELKSARVVGLADQDEASARRLGEPYGIRNVYGSFEELLESMSLDVIHILTPPVFHYPQAAAAVDHGLHVLIEKPCALSAHDAADLYRRAQAKDVSICPDFIQLFHPAYQHALSLIESGQLGGLVHIESHLSLDFDLPELREAVGLHWSYKLPGGVLHNYLTHPLYLALYWLGQPRNIAVSAQSHGSLPQGLTDHLHIILEGESCTASVVLSGAIQPESYYVQLFCEHGVVLVNFDTSTVLVTRESGLPRALRRATANYNQAYQLSTWAVRNIIDFLRHKLVPYQGLQNLIPRFYRSICEGIEVPVSRDLAIAVTKVEEVVFGQAGKLQLDIRDRPSKQIAITRPEKVLVTGASGYVGSQVVQQLVKEGYSVRALVRGLSRIEPLEQLGVELVFGDVRDLGSLSGAAEGMDILIHLAAGLRGTPGFVLASCVQGTDNVADAARRAGLKRVIYMSSMAVYDYATLHDSDIVTEDTPLEPYPELRGTYSLAKRRAEDVALSHLHDASPAWTILRPSVIVGKSKDIFAPVGLKIGKVLICLGSARKHLRLTHVEDVGAAIITLIQNENTCGRVFTLSHPGSLTFRNYVDEYIREMGYRDIIALYAPYWLASFGVIVIMALRKLTGKGPSINMRRLAYLYRDVHVNSNALKAKTGWQPYGNLLERLKATGK